MLFFSNLLLLGWIKIMTSLCLVTNVKELLDISLTEF